MPFTITHPDSIPVSAASSTPLGQRPLSIIVADDVEGIQRLVRHWLEDTGHHVTCASSGNEVVALLKKQAVDLIITDVIMPEGDGLEVIKEMKQAHPQARVLAISGGGAYLRSRDCLNLAKGLGAHAVLMKPFNREELLSAVKAACGVPTVSPPGRPDRPAGSSRRDYADT